MAFDPFVNDELGNSRYGPAKHSNHFARGIAASIATKGITGRDNRATAIRNKCGIMKTTVIRKN